LPTPLRQPVDISRQVPQHGFVLTKLDAVVSAPAGPLVPDGRRWFCIHAKPKHEHIAAAHLLLVPETEVFLPRIRFERPFKGTKIWVVEPLFPTYLFARFDFKRSLAHVRYSSGVHSIVHFGVQIPVIPDAVVAEMRAELGTECIRLVDPAFTVGDEVRIVGGAFAGLQALVTRLMPARERVGVLLEFLGRQVMVEVETAAILKSRSPRDLMKV
jgi:transcriptional antiterminator RfaH